jgi:predicted short-subunit dehydrogenase-like oxidoreductase (DUF2520 family)
MKVMIVGGGGREHAITWAISKSPRVDKIYAAPGNAGIGELAECVDISVMDAEKLVAFAKEKAVDFSRVHIFIEGSNDSTLRLAQTLALSVSPHVHEFSSDERRYLHLSAVFACNFANHCFTLSSQILEAHGLSFDVMLPLIRETAEKVETMHPREAQTGPAVRCDENVLEAQKALLSNEPEMQQIYDLMSKSIQNTGK